MTKVNKSIDITMEFNMGLIGWILILFVGLKLTGFIMWGWLWVLSPIWLLMLLILTVYIYYRVG